MIENRKQNLSIKRMLVLILAVAAILLLSACSKDDGTPKDLEMNNSDTGLEIIMRDFNEASSVTQDYEKGQFLFITCEGSVKGSAALTIAKGDAPPIYERDDFAGAYQEDIIEIEEDGSYEVKIEGKSASGRIYVTTDPSGHTETIEDFIDEELPD